MLFILSTFETGLPLARSSAGKIVGIMNLAANIMSGAQGATGTKATAKEFPKEFSEKTGDSEFSRLVSPANADEAASASEKASSGEKAAPASGNIADLNEKGDLDFAVAAQALDALFPQSLQQGAEFLKSGSLIEGGAGNSGSMPALAAMVAATKEAMDVTAKQPVTGITDFQNASPVRGILEGRSGNLPISQALAGNSQPETLHMLKSVEVTKPASLTEKFDAGFQSPAKPAQGQPNQAAMLANAFMGQQARSFASAPGSLISTDGASSAVSFENTLHVAAEKTLPIQNAVQSSISEVRPGALPVNAVAIEMARQFRGGVNRFQIRLDPPELGRIDIRMHVASDGKVSAHLVVEKPETLIALNRDAPALERALNTAGLSADKSSLNFSLSGGSHGFTNEDDTGNSAVEDDIEFVAGDEIDAMEARVEMSGYITPSGVDIHV